MILDRLRPKTSAAALATRRLYDGAVAQARARPLYASMGLADTPEGRFEALTLHVLLLLDRLKREGREGALAGQRLLEERIGADAAPLASYVCECRAHLSGQSAGDLLAGVASWPAP